DAPRDESDDRRENGEPQDPRQLDEPIGEEGQKTGDRDDGDHVEHSVPEDRTPHPVLELLEGLRKHRELHLDSFPRPSVVPRTALPRLPDFDQFRRQSFRNVHSRPMRPVNKTSIAHESQTAVVRRAMVSRTSVRGTAMATASSESMNANPPPVVFPSSSRAAKSGVVSSNSVARGRTSNVSVDPLSSWRTR